MNELELRDKLLDEMLALAGRAEIPSHAITIRDLMKRGMSESSAYRLLRKQHDKGELNRARGPRGAMYYWPVEGDKP